MVVNYSTDSLKATFSLTSFTQRNLLFLRWTKTAETLRVLTRKVRFVRLAKHAFRNACLAAGTSSDGFNNFDWCPRFQINSGARRRRKSAVRGWLLVRRTR